MTALLDIRLVAVLVLALCGVAVLQARYPQVVLPGLVCLGLLACRPTVLGEPYPVIGPLIVVLAAGCAAISALRRRTPDAGAGYLPYLLFAAVWAWLLLHRLTVQGAEPNVVSSTLTVFLPVMTFLIVTRDRTLVLQIRDCLVVVITAVSALTVLTVLGMLLLGPGALAVGPVPLGYVESSAALYLPGSLSYGLDPGASFPRMLGLGREPGMGALFIGWAFFAMPDHVRRRGFWRLVLVGAMIATQSTAGIGLFGVCFGLSWVIGRERFSPIAATVAAAVGGAVVWFAVFSPVFGLAAKVESGGSSYLGRTQATVNGLQAALEEPWTAHTLAPLSAVNLIASTAVSGLPWFVLVLAFVAAPVFRAGRRDPMTYGSLFVLLVVLTAQPITGSTAILLLVLISYYAVDRFAGRPDVVPLSRGHGTGEWARRRAMSSAGTAGTS